MSVVVAKSWTQNAFFAWAGAQNGRFEFDGVQPVAMTGGTVGHAIIIRNVNAALLQRLKGSACQPLGPEAGVGTSGGAVRYPDALVTCAPLNAAALTVPDVVVVFEVVSQGSSRTDRIVKVREYAAVASIRRYVILESTSRDVTVLERPGPGEPWRTTTLTEGDVLLMPEIGIEMPVVEFYDGLVLGDEDAVRP